MMSEELKRKLDILGNTEDEVADFLLRRNIKGVCNSPRNCPIANYLHHLDPNLTVGRHTLYYGVNTPVLLPTAVKRFIRLFDDGFYPELQLRGDK